MASSERPQLSRRERNKQANRSAILAAGLDVFARLGFERATITDIVGASGLSVGTFYNYFGDKDAVFAELVNDLLTQARAALHDARERATSLDDFVLGAFHAYSRVIGHNPSMQSLISKNTHAFREFVFGGGEIAGIVEDLEVDMNEAIDKGILPKFPVRLMTSAMIGAGAEVFAFEGELSGATPEEKASFLGELFLGGIERIARRA